MAVQKTHDDLLWRQLYDLPAFRALLRAVEARFYQDLPLRRPVLDVGCGDGHFASIAFDAPLEAGFDPYLPALREARRYGGYHRLAQADGARMPYPTAHFATVISNSVLEHISQVDPVLCEVARVLQPGGTFYFCVPGPNFSPFLSLARGFDRIGLRKLAGLYRRFFDRISRHYYYYAPADWEEHLARAGMTLVRWWPYFSRRALAALEWGHYLGLPSLVTKKLVGRWVLWPSRANLWLTERLTRPLYDEPVPPAGGGAYLFLIARRSADLGAATH
jgi:SAM-dependent methyltransferase